MTIKNLPLLVSFALLNGCLASVANAGEANGNFVGPTVTFGNGQSIVGVGGKFKIADQVSVRPAYSFANLAGAGVTVAGGSATYEIDVQNSQIQPFVGVGVNIYTVNTGGTTSSSTTPFAQAGVDLLAGEGVALTGDVKVPMDSSAPLGTVLSIGGGYRF